MDGPNTNTNPSDDRKLHHIHARLDAAAHAAGVPIPLWCGRLVATLDAAADDDARQRVVGDLIGPTKYTIAEIREVAQRAAASNRGLSAGLSLDDPGAHLSRERREIMTSGGGAVPHRRTAQSTAPPPTIANTQERTMDEIEEKDYSDVWPKYIHYNTEDWRGVALGTFKCENEVQFTEARAFMRGLAEGATDDEHNGGEPLSEPGAAVKFWAWITLGDHWEDDVIHEFTVEGFCPGPWVVRDDGNDEHVLDIEPSADKDEAEAAARALARSWLLLEGPVKESESTTITLIQNYCEATGEGTAEWTFEVIVHPDAPPCLDQDEIDDPDSDVDWEHDPEAYSYEESQGHAWSDDDGLVPQAWGSSGTRITTTRVCLRCGLYERNTGYQQLPWPGHPSRTIRYERPDARWE